MITQTNYPIISSRCLFVKVGPLFAREIREVGRRVAWLCWEKRSHEWSSHSYGSTLFNPLASIYRTLATEHGRQEATHTRTACMSTTHTRILSRISAATHVITIVDRLVKTFTVSFAVDAALYLPPFLRYSSRRPVARASRNI